MGGMGGIPPVSISEPRLVGLLKVLGAAASTSAILAFGCELLWKSA